MSASIIPDIPSRKQVIEQSRRSGKLVAAVFPIHYPRELLRAFNIQPIEVWGPPKVDVRSGATHLQPYICSVVKSGLSFLLQGGLSDVDVILVPHCCDSLQGLGSILLDFIKPKQPVLTFYLPRRRGDSDVEFLAKEIESLYNRLGEITGFKPAKDDLLDATFEEEKADETVLLLYDKRRKLSLGSYEFYRLIRLREYMPAEDFIKLVKKVLSATDERRENKSIPLLVSGVLPEPMEVLREIDKTGAYVAGDDFACCRRRIYGKGVSDDPFIRMAERIVLGPPDPMKGSSLEERISFLEGLIMESGAKGVVLYNVKFCEPEHFYYPLIRGWLRRKGINCVQIEVDINDPLPQQVVTRITALVETIKGAQEANGYFG